MAKYRILNNKLRSLSESYPVIAVTGPRQSGKSTLIRATFPDRPYANLEATRTLEFAKSDPAAFLAQFPEGAVIDEVQKAPALLSDIQVIVDEKKLKGMFILSGSENLQLSESISQSLAGRIQTLKLLPLSLEETPAFKPEATDLNSYLFRGFYPSIYEDKLDPTEAYGSYVETYIERDVRNLLQIHELSLFRRFIELAASRSGQLLNKDSLANDAGISPSTVEKWLSVLEATFVCFRLRPWFVNVGKRLVKSPKLYFYDVGLLSYLLGINSASQLQSHPLRGAIFETLQVAELQKALWNHNLRNQIFFYRDSHGNEVDLLLQNGQNFIPIEVKSAQTFHSSFLKGIHSFQKVCEKTKLHRCEGPAIVLGGDEEQKRQEFEILPWNKIGAWSLKRLGA